MRARERRGLEHELGDERARTCGRRNRGRRLESTLPDGTRSGGRREEVDERFRGGGRLRRGHEACGEHGDALRPARQRSDVVDARDWKQLADLLKADLDVSAREQRADRSAVDHPALGPNRVGDPEARKELREEVDAAGAGGKANRLRVQQGLLEGFERADVGLRGAGAHGHPDAGSYEIDAAPGGHLPVLDQIIERRRRENHDVDRLAALQPVGNRAWGGADRGAEGRHHLVA